MREAGLEPARPKWTLEPESSESANSTTRALRRLSTAAISYHVEVKMSSKNRLFFPPISSPGLVHHVILCDLLEIVAALFPAAAEGLVIDPRQTEALIVAAELLVAVGVVPVVIAAKVHA